VLSKLLLATLLAMLLTACATEFKVFEAKNNVFEGAGGTKVVVDGMDVWDNGEPPKKFKILGFVEDERPGGPIYMAQLRGDVVRKARQAGGDAVIQVGSQSQISGYYSSGAGTATSVGDTTTATGFNSTVAIRRSTSKFAVIKYLE
jgi:hypothetical protein